jgi:hypothetical protein
MPREASCDANFSEGRIVASGETEEDDDEDEEEEEDDAAASDDSGGASPAGGQKRRSTSGRVDKSSDRSASAAPVSSVVSKSHSRVTHLV